MALKIVNLRFWVYPHSRTQISSNSFKSFKFPNLGILVLWVGPVSDVLDVWKTMPGKGPLDWRRGVIVGVIIGVDADVGAQMRCHVSRRSPSWGSLDQDNLAADLGDSGPEEDQNVVPLGPMDAVTQMIHLFAILGL